MKYSSKRADSHFIGEVLQAPNEDILEAKFLVCQPTKMNVFCLSSQKRKLLKKLTLRTSFRNYQSQLPKVVPSAQ